MTYNMTLFANSTNIYSMVDAINQETSYIIGILAMVSVFIILLFNLMRNNPPAESFFAASFATALLGLIFLTVELISIVWFIAAVAILAMSGISLYLVNRTS